MKLMIAARHRPNGERERSAVLHIFARILRRFSNRIAEVRVVVEDINGPKGGTDQRCCAELELEQGRRISVVAFGETSLQAIRRAAQKARKRVVRIRERHHSQRRFARRSTLPEMS